MIALTEIHPPTLACDLDFTPSCERQSQQRKSHRGKERESSKSKPYGPSPSPNNVSQSRDSLMQSRDNFRVSTTVTMPMELELASFVRHALNIRHLYSTCPIFFSSTHLTTSLWQNLNLPFRLYNQFVIVGIIFTVTLPHHAHLSAHILNASTSPPIQSPSSTVQFLFPLALWCRTSISSSWHSKPIFSKLHLLVDQKKRLTIVWPHSTPSNYVYTTRTRGKGLLGVLDLKIGWSFCSKFCYFTICLQY